MGRKNLPSSSGGNKRVGTKKQDTGLPSFFKHRKQQAAQAAPATNVKGKNRLNAQQTPATSSSSSSQLADTIRNAAAGGASTAIVDPSASIEGASSSASSFSTYDHLSQGAFHGGTKDSSVKAYGRHLRSLIEQSDVLIQVLDARDPMGSRSIASENLLLSHPGKKLLLVLTKIDLVPKATLQAWLVHLRQFHPTLAFKSTSTLSATGRSSRKLYTQTALTAAGGAVTSLEASSSATLLQLLKNYARSQPKGMSLTVGIFGPPNVGKSSLINSLVRSRACSVAPRPGETKALQTVLLDRKVRLIDSPGVAMPSSNVSMDSQTEEVLRGTVKVELVEDPITPVAAILKRADPVKVTKLYGLPEIDLGEGDGDDIEGDVAAASPPQVQKMDVGEGAGVQAQKPSGKVDFNTMRDEDSDNEDDNDDADDDSDDDFHRDDFQEPDDADLDADADEMTAQTSAPRARGAPRPRGPIGYDASDPMDFLLRLALTKGKMLRGGRPDVEGAARGVINDWNSGKIAWFVRPPLASTSVEARKKQREQKAATTADDEQMASVVAEAPPSRADGSTADGDAAERRREEAKTQEDPTVVAGFSQAFDLDALFAQADAQMFGGGGGGEGNGDATNKAPASTSAAADKPAPGATPSSVNLQAADVSRSSLGKRGRADAEDDDDDDAGDVDASDGSDSDSDDEEGTRRMSMPGKPTTADADAMEGVSQQQARAKQDKPRGGQDELAAFLASSSTPTTTTSTTPRDAKNTQRPATNSTAGPAKRGQRNKKKKNRNLEAHDDDGDVPSYIARQQHKATLPVNMKKAHILTDDTFDDVGIGRGTTAKKRGEERKKKRKLARREGREDGGVWKELEEVTLD